MYHSQYYKIIGIILLFFTLVSCDNKDTKIWKTTENDCLFFGKADNDNIEYQWDGNTLEKVIHGIGTLSSYKDGNLIDNKTVEAYYGTIAKSDINQISSSEQYIGSTDENGFMSGFGVLINGNDIYIGNFTNSQPEGFLTLYKDGNVYYKGEWRNGAFDGNGTLYKEDGTVKGGVWSQGKLAKTETTIDTENGEYTGTIENNAPEGFGTMKYKSGSIYQGNWSNGKWSGEGTYVSPDDSITGEWNNGVLDGYAIFKTNDFLYEGDWANNKPEGIGYMTRSDSTYYSGGWTNGKKDGYGDIFFANGDSYLGEWDDDLYQGLGHYIYSNGDSYYGQWKNGLQDGAGEYVSKDYIYEGNWEEGWMNGNGKLTLANGDSYEGGFVENKKFGTGIYHFKNGNIYEGEFVNDTINGLGVFTFADGNIYEGEFENGKIKGDGTLYYADETDSITITANWDGSTNFPHIASVLFSNGDLYEGELKDGFPTENGIWTTEAERLSQKEPIKTDIVHRANDFYKRHRDTFKKVVLFASVALAAVAVAQFLGVVAVGVGGISMMMTVITVADIGPDIGSASIDLFDSIANGGSYKKPLKTLSKKVAESAVYKFMPKVLKTKPARKALAGLSDIAKKTARKSMIKLSKSKIFNKVVKVVRDSKGQFVKKLNTAKTTFARTKVGIFYYRLTLGHSPQYFNYDEYIKWQSSNKLKMKDLDLVSPPSSEKLRKNMKICIGKNKSDIVKLEKDAAGKGAQAHHIIAGKSPGAEQARNIIEKYDINVNHPLNGILLPTSPRSIFKGSKHGTHVSIYDDYISKRMQELDSKLSKMVPPPSKEYAQKEIFKVLDEIKCELISGQRALLKDGFTNTIFNSFYNAKQNLSNQ